MYLVLGAFNVDPFSLSRKAHASREALNPVRCRSQLEDASSNAGNSGPYQQF